jgi:hypothetical protein
MRQKQNQAGRKDFVARKFARGLLAPLPAHTPVADAYEREKRELHPHAGEPWYTSQKQHITGWLNELGGPGAYNRKSRGLGARHFWNHFQCAAIRKTIPWERIAELAIARGVVK